MGRRRTTPPVQLPDRIPPADLRHWMKINDISINKLALELSVRYRTVEGWLRGYRPAPAWLEQRVNYLAMGRPKLPFYGKRWEDALPIDEVRGKRAIDGLLGGDPPPVSGEPLDYAPLPEQWANLPEAPDNLFDDLPKKETPAGLKAALQAAICEHCGSTLTPAGECAWPSCPGDDPDAD